VIEARGLSKRFGDKLAVDQLSFTVHPGRVTGFLGPNGAGKSTTMRMIVGLDAPTSGSVTVNGRPYRQLPYPMREVGALLEARAVHGGRSAFQHLLCLAHMNAIPVSRVNEVLALVGLTEVARRRTKGFSMGMGQRLGVAAALLGDPRVLLFDEPVNGFDPEGIRWIRHLMKTLAAQGRTVFVSSHLMSEMQNTADHLIVIGRGRLIADCSMAEFIGRYSAQVVTVRTPQPEAVAALVSRAGGQAGPVPDGTLVVRGLPAGRISDLAYENGVRLHEVATVRASLEEAYMALTAHAAEYRAGGYGPQSATPPMNPPPMNPPPMNPPPMNPWR
jgi:ABC-2 type transport system ATP-binding protein